MSSASINVASSENRSLIVHRFIVAIGILFCALLFIVMFGYVYYCWGDILMFFFPPCIFYAVTGLQCPSCGLQRALFNLVHGNIIEAIRFNALVVFFIALCLWLMVKTMWRYVIEGIVKLPEIKSCYVYLTVLIILTFAIGRNF